jgi:hypothetical protein
VPSGKTITPSPFDYFRARPRNIAPILPVNKNRSHIAHDFPSQKPTLNFSFRHENAFYDRAKRGNVRIAQMIADKKKRRSGRRADDFDFHIRDYDKCPRPCTESKLPPKNFIRYKRRCNKPETIDSERRNDEQNVSEKRAKMFHKNYCSL